MMDPYTKAELLKLLRETLKSVELLQVRKCCADCRHFDVPLCGLVNQKPPADVLENGCEAYVFDETKPPF